MTRPKACAVLDVTWWSNPFLLKVQVCECAFMLQYKVAFCFLHFNAAHNNDCEARSGTSEHVYVGIVFSVEQKQTTSEYRRLCCFTLVHTYTLLAILSQSLIVDRHPGV